jgi:hypothetical protein
MIKYIAGALMCIPAAYLLFLFFSVILFGAGSSCPQNLC